MPFPFASWKAAALAWPLFVLVCALLPMAAVHGVGGAWTHGHHGAVSDHSAVGVHTPSEEGTHGDQSFTMAAQEQGPDHHDMGAECAQTAPTDAASTHSDADCVSVTAPAGLFSLLLWPASLSDGIRSQVPRPPRAVAVLWRRKRSIRFRPTLLRLAQLSVLRL